MIDTWHVQKYKLLTRHFRDLQLHFEQDDEELVSPSQHKEKLDCLCDWDLFILFCLSGIQGAAADIVLRK